MAMRYNVNPVTYEILTRRVKQLGNLPAMPTVLTTICEALSVSAHKVDIDKVIETLSYDKSLVAQCLRMANSALYRQRGDVSSVRDAVLTLGLWRIRDLAFSCSLPLMFASLGGAVPKEAFWSHALGTAVVAQKLGADFGESHSEQTYLAGLLHDIGILVNGLLFPEDFREVLEAAVREQVPVVIVEQRVMGFTHAESGRIAAELWRLPLEISEVIEFHHRQEEQKTNNELTVLVQIANRLCWNSGLGYGYQPAEYLSLSGEEIWLELARRFPRARHRAGGDYAAVLENHLAGARELVAHVFGLPALVQQDSPARSLN